MAATITFYNDGKTGIMNSTIDLDGDTIKVSLHTSTYSPDIDAHTTTADLTNELSASGNYTTGGETLAGKSVAADDTNDRAVFDATDLTWTALTPSAAFRYGVMYSVTASSALICYIDFGADQNPGGSDFTISWNASGIAYI